MIQTLQEEELFGMKICALIDRSKPRDLIDVNKMKECLFYLDDNLLKKMIVFYMSLDGLFEVSETTLDKIKLIDKEDIKKELLPVLSKNSKFDLEEVKEKVISFLKELLMLTDDEHNYLREFANGTFNLSLLFVSPYAERTAKHPMAKWRVPNNKK